MTTVRTALNSGFTRAAESLVCAGLKSLLGVPVEGAIAWLEKRFTDHSRALPAAITAANDRAWQAVALALAGDDLYTGIKGLFSSGDLKAVRDQIRAFVAHADTGLTDSPARLRVRACDELNRLKRAGVLGLSRNDLGALDLSRFASTAEVADDARRAVLLIAEELKAPAPHLAQVLTLTPPGGGVPLFAAAFAFFLRRQIATNPELSREFTADGVQLLTRAQQRGFEQLEDSLSSKWADLHESLGGWFAATDAELGDIKAKLEQLLEQNHVPKQAEAPLRVSVTSEEERQRLEMLRTRLRQIPPELVDAKLQSLLGDGLASAGQFAEALREHTAAAETANQTADREAEGEAAFKQFKDACELRTWAAAFESLTRAIALDEKRFRPVPKHYAADAVLGAGTFGVVLRCRNTIAFDEDGNELTLAVKTFREADLDRPLKDVFAEATTLKALSHPNVIGVLDWGYADQDAQKRPFLAMEFFPGATLEDHLAKHGRLNPVAFVTVFRQVALGLHAAHTGRRPVVHRDLKPANVMVSNESGTWRVKLIDFGLAVRSAVRTSSLSVPHALRGTRDKRVTGTIKYAAPEQLGEKPYPVGPHSDVYAFGKTAMESLFGTTEPKSRHWDELPAAVRGDLQKLLEQCTEEDLGEGHRLRSFAPIIDALNRLDQGGQASPPTDRPKAKARPREPASEVRPEAPVPTAESAPVAPRANKEEAPVTPKERSGPGPGKPAAAEFSPATPKERPEVDPGKPASPKATAVTPKEVLSADAPPFDDLLLDLEPLTDEPTAAPESDSQDRPSPSRPRKRSGRLTSRRGFLVGSGVLGAGLLGGGWWTFTRTDRLKAEAKARLKKIGAAVHNFHSAYQYFPAGIVGKSVSIGLSWRVAILPFLEEANLYNEFDLTEPWDSPRNRVLLGKMPEVFASSGRPESGGKTHLQSFVGETAFLPATADGKPAGYSYRTPGQPAQGRSIASFADGTSNTLIVAEAPDPVEWTKPADLPFFGNIGPNSPAVPKLGGVFDDGFCGLMCDGSAFFYPTTLSEKTLRAMICINDGHVLDSDFDQRK